MILKGRVEFDSARIEIEKSTDNGEFLFLDQGSEDLAFLLNGANRVVDVLDGTQIEEIGVRSVGVQVRGDGRSDLGDEVLNVFRCRGALGLELVHGGLNDPAPGVSQDHDEWSLKTRGRKFHACQKGWGNHVSGDSEHDEISEALIKDKFGGDS